ncbi:hypothetical protein DFA_09963 [Cavenderia fasciculata]|uniref:Uncharacterized protein n=1 Tax=Cavenderia fasciculata TaxID=261658 RepID=F4Q8X0_CACFS|nr:uncharacterized protein DFA_09963 [Cavenderia fasciculata]EGG15139.1 hypothetical protein DFA_09963 [Cavenderia fasciculata]|eukprot:XP_004351859.1 hypothetical protein DFA_09963 [Cavenderia fasciculata]
MNPEDPLYLYYLGKARELTTLAHCNKTTINTWVGKEGRDMMNTSHPPIPPITTYSLREKGRMR